MDKNMKQSIKMLAGALVVFAILIIMFSSAGNKTASTNAASSRSTNSSSEKTTASESDKDDVSSSLDSSELNDLVLDALDYYETHQGTAAYNYAKAASTYATLPTKAGTTQADIDAAVSILWSLREEAIAEDDAAEQSTGKEADDNKPEETSVEQSTPEITTSQSNAVARAKQYISRSAFSHDGLVEQLEYEKYSHDDAVYGADNCGADWMEQAVIKGKSYISISAHSYEGLIEQLEYEKFTHDEAVYGADNCGADWMEQAAKKAESYVSRSSFSRGSLIDQLKYEGFTDEQAAYGASSVGL